MTPDCACTFPAPENIDFAAGQRFVRVGIRDPAFRQEGDIVYRAHRGPEGPVALRLRHDRAANTITFEAFGPGAPWALQNAAALAGLENRPFEFGTDHLRLRPLLARERRRYLARSLTIVERLPPIVLQQLVTAREAAATWQSLVRTHGEDAPGSFGLRLGPRPNVLAGLPHAGLVQLGVLPSRIRTLWEIGRRAEKLDSLVTLEPAEAARLLRVIPGIGPWTSDWVIAGALGWSDAAPTGDYHMPQEVCRFLAEEPDGDDARMLELLEPFRPHRLRVIQMIRRVAPNPRHGPLPSRVGRG